MATFEKMLTTVRDVNMKNKNNKTLLQIAIEKKDVEKVKTLIKYVDINAIDFQGKTVLHKMVHCIREPGPVKATQLREDGANHKIVILDKLLNAKNIDVNKCDHHGKSALYYALHSDPIQWYFSEKLILHDANPNITCLFKTKETPLLLFLILQNAWKFLKMVLGKSPQVKMEACDERGVQAIHYLAYWFTYDPKLYMREIMELLLKKVDINVPTYKGSTPLHFAVKANNKMAVKYLLEKGADKDKADTQGRIPGKLANDLEFKEIVKLFQNPQEDSTDNLSCNL